MQVYIGFYFLIKVFCLFWRINYILKTSAFKQTKETKKELKAGGGIEAPLYVAKAKQGKYSLAPLATAADIAPGSSLGSKQDKMTAA